MRPSVIPRDRLIQELKGAIILRDLTPRELKRFAPICDLREYSPEERIVEQDSLGPELHILLEGSVQIRLRGAEGEEVTVNTIQKGDVLGEAAIFMNLPRTASAVASTACIVATVPRDSLFVFCDKNAKAGLKIFTVVIYSLLKRLGATTRELVAEREAVVTGEDLERLRSWFPKSLEDMLEG
jgi:CRP-like cAMP-binding protein